MTLETKAGYGPGAGRVPEHPQTSSGRGQSQTKEVWISGLELGSQIQTRDAVTEVTVQGCQDIPAISD